jgi:polar amino acid transport system permease protein
MPTDLNLNHIDFLLQGALWTAGLSLIAFLGGGVGGAVVALCRISGSQAVRTISNLYVQLVQGTPLLVLLFLSYFGLAAIGLRVPSLIAAGASLTIYVSAFVGEIWRGCLESVPRAQWEAAECLALGCTQRMLKVILPQAVRIATPPTVGFMVQIIKATSLASAVGFVELARAGQIINNSLFKPFLIYVIVACLYFAMCYPISRWSRVLERRRSLPRARRLRAA